MNFEVAKGFKLNRRERKCLISLFLWTFVGIVHPLRPSDLLNQDHVTMTLRYGVKSFLVSRGRFHWVWNIKVSEARGARRVSDLGRWLPVNWVTTLNLHILLIHCLVWHYCFLLPKWEEKSRKHSDL